jgi:hypothetical protein
MNQNDEIKERFIEFWKTSGKEKVFRIRGTSMLPLIRECDAIGVIPVASISDLKIGDIAVYKSKTGIIAHRIIGKYKRGNTILLREKGDRGAMLQTIYGEQIIGKVIKIYQPETTINLGSRLWLFINYSVGHYWQVVFACVDFMGKTKALLFGSKKFPHIASLYQRIISIIINLPAIILRRR